MDEIKISHSYSDIDYINVYDLKDVSYSSLLTYLQNNKSRKIGLGYVEKSGDPTFGSQTYFIYNEDTLVPNKEVIEDHIAFSTKHSDFLEALCKLYKEYNLSYMSNTIIHRARRGLNGGGNGLPKMITHNKWSATDRKVTLKDGSKRTLYNNAGKPGEFRIRRMSTRAGQTVATYIKPPK